MKITATDTPLLVHFRKDGKRYSQSPLPEGEGAGVNTDQRSDFPYDTVRLELGESFEQSDVVIVQIREASPIADQAEPPVAP